MPPSFVAGCSLQVNIVSKLPTLAAYIVKLLPAALHSSVGNILQQNYLATQTLQIDFSSVITWTMPSVLHIISWVKSPAVRIAVQVSDQDMGKVTADQ